jgi:hypothetical protein
VDWSQRGHQRKGSETHTDETADFASESAFPGAVDAIADVRTKHTGENHDEEESVGS